MTDHDLNWIDDPHDDPTEGDDFAVWSFDTGAIEPPLVEQTRPSIPPTGGTATLTVRTARRATRRRTTARPADQTASIWWSALRNLAVALAAAVLVSTIFSLWTRPNFFSDEFRAGLNEVQATQRVIQIQPSPLPTDVHQIRIGIVAGHSGRPQDPNFETDPGAVCPDGLTELEINEAVARRVVTILSQDRYMVDLLTEFDPRLEGYQADVLVSIHSNDCQDYGPAGTGFNAASASARQTTRGEDEKLLACLISQYAATTGLPQHYGLTYDMTEYHTFSEVAVDTPTAIIEIGFLRNDRAFLTQQQDLIAQGIVNGIRCFLLPSSSTPASSP
jgi:N-acetylmuramoyl-L-alanine amidase